MPDRKPDAVLYPIDAIDEATKDKHHKELSRLLGGTLRWALVAHNHTKLGVLDPGQYTFLFPHGHPWQGRDRFEWFVADRQEDARKVGTWTALMPYTGDEEEANEVLLGFAVADPFADDAEAQASITSELDRRKDEARARMAAYNAQVEAERAAEGGDHVS